MKTTLCHSSLKPGFSSLWYVDSRTYSTTLLDGAIEFQPPTQPLMWLLHKQIAVACVDAVKITTAFITCHVREPAGALARVLSGLGYCRDRS